MTSMPPKLEELTQSMHEQVSLLLSAAGIEATGTPDLRDELAREHLRRATELVRGAAALGANLNPMCLGMLSRPLLEQLINLLWSIRSLENAEAHQASSKAALAKAFRINLEKDKAKVRSKITGEDATAEFVESDAMKKIPKQKNVEEKAKEADVLDLYTVFYRFLSLDTHGHRINSEEISAESLSVIHLQGIGAISRAIGQASVWWLLHRGWPDNESIRNILGLNFE
jgi:hypothetical protein